MVTGLLHPEHQSDVNPRLFKHDGQLFSFLPEDVDNLFWSRIEFDIDHAKILSSTPVVLTSQIGENDTDVDQSFTFEKRMTVEESTSAEHSHGFSIMVGVEGGGGIPFIADGKVKSEATTTHDWKYGKNNSRSAEIVGTFPVVIPPHSAVKS